MKNTSQVYQFLFLAVFAVSSFALAKQTFTGEKAEAKVEGVATLTIDWVKDKKNKFDAHMAIHNERKDTGIIIFLGSMGCARGAVTGVLKHTFFNTGERTIDLRPGQTKDFNVVCKLSSATKGIYKISLGQIWENPTLDGKTKGKSLAEDLVWSQADE